MTIEPHEISRLINKCKLHFTFHEGSMTNLLLKKKHLIIYHYRYLLYSINLSMGEFPISYKKSIVIPVPKNANIKHCTNYRPRTLTLTISKMLEKCVKRRLTEFLDKNKLFNKNQFGFKSNLSTMEAIYYATKIITYYLNAKKK